MQPQTDLKYSLFKCLVVEYIFSIEKKVKSSFVNALLRIKTDIIPI